MTKPFSKMTKAEKRVAVAKDVLWRVKKGLITPNHGSYVTNDDGKCACCALGSMMLSKCELRGAAPERPPYGTGEYGVAEELQDLFSVEQLVLIEEAFDDVSLVADAVDPDGAIDVDVKAAHEAYNKLCDGSTTAHLVAIMENIVANKGTFVPERLVAK